jgi:hypothetical protein
MSIEDVVAQHQRAGVIADEVGADDESLCQTLGRGLHRVLDMQSPLRAIAEQLFEARRVLRGGNQQDVADPRQHQRGQRVVHHRLVVYRQQLLGDRLGDGIQPGARAAGEDDALARAHAALPA